jgi:homocysteine S-methyltransferase
MLISKGIHPEICLDELNISNPSIIKEIHSEYIEAGANIILANTFSSNRFKLEKYGLLGKIQEINTAGVNNARAAANASGKDILIAGDVGPLGVRLAPFGRIQPEEAMEAFTEQIEALVDAGVDLIVIETITDLQEAKIAVKVAKGLTKKPVVISATFTRDGRTLLGDTPTQAANILAETDADVIGVNCSGGPTQLLRILTQMIQDQPSKKFWVKPNAGWPEIVSGRMIYPAEPDYFGNYAISFKNAGASIIGGCCGTTPKHIAAIYGTLQQEPAVSNSAKIRFAPIEPTNTEFEAEPPTQLSQKLSAGRFAIAAEMSPPRGLSVHKLLAGAKILIEAGVDVIDVNDSPMARMRMSAWAVCDLLQQKLGVETTIHFPTRGRNLIRIQGDLLAVHALGIRNIFVVMGDPASIGDYPDATDNYDIVPSGLIQLIKHGFNTGRDHAGANIDQPTNFFAGAALNLNPKDPQTEIKNLKRKLAAGADFFLTQPVFDPGQARQLIEHYEVENGPVGKPILVGIMPLFSERHVNFLHNEVPGITIPQPIRDRMSQAGENGVKTGIQVAKQLTDEIRTFAQGVYIMPQFDRYDVAAEIVENIRSAD